MIIRNHFNVSTIKLPEYLFVTQNLKMKECNIILFSVICCGKAYKCQMHFALNYIWLPSDKNILTHFTLCIYLRWYSNHQADVSEGNREKEWFHILATQWKCSCTSLSTMCPSEMEICYLWQCSTSSLLDHRGHNAGGFHACDAESDYCTNMTQTYCIL